MVSVIVCVRNGEAYLEEALESIRRQTLPPDEILLVDGHSTDRTLAIAAQYPQVRCLTQAGDTLPDAYNTGVLASQGDLVAFLSHDDRWLPDKLRLQAASLQQEPELGYVTGHFRYFLQGERTPPGFRAALLEGEHPGPIFEAMLVRRQTLQQVGLLDRRYDRTAHDVDWFARAHHLQVKSRCLPQVVLEKRVHGGSTSLPESHRDLLTVLKRSLDRRRSSC